MPSEDLIYYPRRISTQSFIDLIRFASHNQLLVSRVGYENAARLFQDMSGVPILLSREETRVKSGDLLVVGKLSYRLADPSMKRDKSFQDSLKVSDYIFYACPVSSLERFLSLKQETLFALMGSDEAAFIEALKTMALSQQKENDKAMQNPRM